jgi:hypothetical protein
MIPELDIAIKGLDLLSHPGSKPSRGLSLKRKTDFLSKCQEPSKTPPISLE